MGLTTETAGQSAVGSNGGRPAMLRRHLSRRDPEGRTHADPLVFSGVGNSHEGGSMTNLSPAKLFLAAALVAAIIVALVAWLRR
jgi:hypothetical protein